MVAYSFRKQFVQPIRVGLSSVSLSFDCPPKRQTIRADRKRRARAGEELQLYCGMRTEHCFLIGRALCTDVLKITLWFGVDNNLGVNIDGRYFCGSTECEEFSQADGFDSVTNMIAFWRKEHASIDRFDGVLIKWVPL